MIIEQLQCQLDSLMEASEQAHNSATHEESKAENKYDTRGLEAAYLAHGLSVRAEEIQQAIIAYRNLTLLNFMEDTPVQQTALVSLESEGGMLRWFFIGPQAGGLKLLVGDREVTVLTPTAPLGKALLGKFADDEFSLSTNGLQKNYMLCTVE